MIKVNKSKLGQGLPLNTIVIAILVIIVLLVIVVFFTTKVGDAGKQINNNGDVSACSASSNPTIQTLGYNSAEYLESDVCADRGGSKISVVENDEDGNVCCGFK